MKSALPCSSVLTCSTSTFSKPIRKSRTATQVTQEQKDRVKTFSRSKAVAVATLLACYMYHCAISLRERSAVRSGAVVFTFDTWSSDYDGNLEERRAA